ncbi:L-lysine 6-monooxygenase [Actinomadura spongiicola]|uniref:L-lysine N6-monooxygenase MbtG n=1 Tax=Actinomadura spongiicola TaxID=2303421 RepID=A0A372GG12_9ACTN|nr:SidA/IucD/PvdA family monooxygenase [Actinomadura spongiicola]RFS84310.1 L-lysine 6-monooxygenase [Actinomadura spongiicola]
MQEFDVIGVGLGPSNLSLAALLEPLPDIRARFYEAQETFRWHCGIMVPGAQLQVSYLKDLVTLVDPSNPLSFLNYLAQEGRLYRFLIAHADRCSRQEFERYYQWAADRLKSIRWGRAVERVELRGDRLEVICSDARPVAARNVVLGSGRTPFMPPYAERLRGDTVLHSSELVDRAPETGGRNVMVIGAGQSGAEVVHHLLSADDRALPASLTWVSSRVGFLPMDDSPFTNEWFHPAYVDHFHGLTAQRRRLLLDRQRLASDGVTESLLQDIYRRLYELDVIKAAGFRHRLLAGHRLIDLTRDGGRLVAALCDDDTGMIESASVDTVICCTGYRAEFPSYLEPLRGRLPDTDGTLQVRHDYSLVWDGPGHLGLYVQNAAEDTHGIADPNLSLSSWRSARIINAVHGRTVYQIENEQATIAWRRGDCPPPAVQAPAPQAPEVQAL